MVRVQLHPGGRRYGPVCGRPSAVRAILCIRFVSRNGPSVPRCGVIFPQNYQQKKKSGKHTTQVRCTSVIIDVIALKKHQPLGLENVLRCFGDQNKITVFFFCGFWWSFFLEDSTRHWMSVPLIKSLTQKQKYLCNTA